MKTFEVKQGMNGSGKTVFVVFTMRDGVVKGRDEFETMAEAQNWVKWA